MTDFKREERYIVVKIKDMTLAQRVALQCHLEVHGTPTRECVVVESDWPIYEETWENVQRVAEGRPSIGEERDALAAHVERLREAMRACIESDWSVPAEEAVEEELSSEATTSLARLKAGWQAEGALAVRHLTQGDDWEDDYLRAVIDDYVAGIRRQAKGEGQ